MQAGPVPLHGGFVGTVGAAVGSGVAVVGGAAVVVVVVVVVVGSGCGRVRVLIGSVGATVGAFVGIAVGASVGIAVGASVGIAVGASVGGVSWQLPHVVLTSRQRFALSSQDRLP